MAILPENEEILIPILSDLNLSSVSRLCTLLEELSINHLEITLRFDSALQVIEAIKRCNPRLCVLAGTVMNSAQLSDAFYAGADIAVSPGLDMQLVRTAIVNNWPMIPAAQTIGELMQLSNEGVTWVKLFPFQLLGGINYLNSIQSIFPKQKFMLTGGIKMSEVDGLFQCKNVGAIGSSQIINTQYLVSQQWDMLKAELSGLMLRRKRSSSSSLAHNPECVTS